MKHLISFLFLLSILFFNSCKSDVERAEALLLENKFDEAFELYQKAANEGNAYAKWKLSFAYKNGLGIETDWDKAMALLQESSKQGCEEATFDLASAYMFGILKFKVDEAKGRNMLQNLVTNSKNIYVQTKYARLLLQGKGFEEDKGKASKILEKYADTNNQYYNRAMSELYILGTDKIDINYQKAISFLEKAYNEGSGSAAFLIAQIYLGYGDISKDLDKQVFWLKKGSDRENSDCQHYLGRIYISNDTTFVKYHNIPKGLELIKKAARHGNGDAYASLGDIYSSGEYSTKDDNLSFEYYSKSHYYKSASGSFSLGWNYINGVGCEKDVAKGIDMWKDASEYGSGAAANNLYCYYYGDKQFNGIVDKEKAKHYLQLSAELGDNKGCWNLAKAYYYGENYFFPLFDKNDQQAFIYAKIAADNGQIDACEFVAYCYENAIGCEKDPQKAKKYIDKTKAKDNTQNED